MISMARREREDRAIAERNCSAWPTLLGIKMECFSGLGRDVVLGIMMLFGISAAFVVYCTVDRLQEKFWPGPQPNKVMPVIGFFPAMLTIWAIASLVDAAVVALLC